MSSDEYLQGSASECIVLNQFLHDISQQLTQLLIHVSIFIGYVCDDDLWKAVAAEAIPEYVTVLFFHTDDPVGPVDIVMGYAMLCLWTGAS